MGEVLEVDEILCYISNKVDVVPNEQLVDICVNSFDSNEISASKLRLFTKCERGPDNDPPDEGVKFIARRGPNSAKNNVQDIIGLLLELGADAPLFAAVNLNKLPPISIENIDVKALLKMVESLNTDVQVLKKCVSKQQLTITDLHETVRAQNVPSESAPNTEQVVNNAVELSAQQSVDVSTAATSSNTNMQNNVNSYANRLKAPAPPRVNRRQTFVTGNGKPTTNASKLTGVRREKRAHVFVTRLSPDCEANDIVDFFDKNFNVNAIVEKLVTNHDDVFSSFHITCECEPSVLLNADLWPEHCLIRRWWNRSRTPT